MSLVQFGVNWVQHKAAGLLAVFLLAQVMAHAALACVAPDLRTDIPPPNGGNTNDVRVSVVVADIMDVDDVGQQINLDLYLTLRWRDERLVDYEGCRFSLDKVWFPRVRILNSANLRRAAQQQRNQVAVEADGHVRYVQRFTGLISSYHNLREFPFDSHAFQIDMGAPAQGHNVVTLSPDTKNTWIAERLNIEGWVIGKIGLQVDDAHWRKAQFDLNIVSLTIEGKRIPEFYVYRVLLLLTFVVAMSWVIFWVPPERFEFQIGIGATSMLTAIAFNLAVSGQLPPVGYLTKLDKMLIWAILLILLSIFEALLAGRLDMKGKKDAALRMDRISRKAFPAAFVLGWGLLVLS